MTPLTRESPLDSRTGQLLRLAADARLPSRRLALAALVCLLIGLASAGAGLVLAPVATWGGLLANWLFWTGLAQGGVLLPAAFHLTESRWGRVVQRLGAGLAAFLPLALLILALLPFGSERLYQGRSFGPVFLRDGAALLVMAGLSLAFLYFVVRPDLRADGREGDTGSLERWLTRGWRGDREERERSRRILRPLSAALVIGYFPAYALVAGDLGMSPEPGFHSTIYPLLYLCGSFYSALGLTAVLAAVWGRSGEHLLRDVITPCELRDLGNLLWAFAIFLGYLWWCQYLIVWMGNLPGEAAHHLHRWREWPWEGLAGSALACAFGVPFLLLFSRTLKKQDLVLAAAGGISALGVLLQQLLDVLPSLRPEPGIVAALVQPGLALGFLGVAALPYLWLMARIPPFPVNDPLFAEELRLRDVVV